MVCRRSVRWSGRRIRSPARSRVSSRSGSVAVGQRAIEAAGLRHAPGRLERLRQWWEQEDVFGYGLILPWVIPTALSTLGWWWMFDSLYSVVNWTAIRLGLMSAPGPNWLGQSSYAMAAVIVVNIWRGLPFFAITVLAGLMSIPREFYEAAEVDGATSRQRFWHVTLPLLKPVLAVVVLFSTIFTFSDFNIVQVLTRGGPVNTTHLFATLAYQIGLQGGNLGQGAAISLFLFPMLALVVFLQLRYIRKE